MNEWEVLSTISNFRSQNRDAGKSPTHHVMPPEPELDPIPVPGPQTQKTFLQAGDGFSLSHASWPHRPFSIVCLKSLDDTWRPVLLLKHQD